MPAFKVSEAAERLLQQKMIVFFQAFGDKKHIYRNQKPIFIDAGNLYFTTVKEVFVTDIQPYKTLSEPQMLINDLPDAGQHRLDYANLATSKFPFKRLLKICSEFMF